MSPFRVLAGAAALAAAACQGTVTTGDPGCTLHLDPVGSTAVELREHASTELAVRASCPAPAPVSFAFSGDAAGARLSAAESTADAAGVARTTLAAGTPGSFTVTASLRGRRVDFLVTVTRAANPFDGGCSGCGDGGAPDAGAPDAGGAADDAVVVGHTLPAALDCGAAAAATVTVRNTGTTTWSRTGPVGYALGYVGDAAAPLLPPASAPRSVVPPGVLVGPGESFSFPVGLRAPPVPGTYPASFQMVLEGGHWFGGIASSPVVVTCPASSGCTFPQGVPDADFTAHSDTNAALADTINGVMEGLSGCSRGSDCDLGASYPDPQQWFAAVNARLRALGYCAGQHEDGATDEIAVSTTGCAGLWYGYHVFHYGVMKVVWNPGAQRGSWSIPATDCP